MIMYYDQHNGNFPWNLKLCYLLKLNTVVFIFKNTYTVSMELNLYDVTMDPICCNNMKRIK